MAKKTWVARLYLGRDAGGKQQFKWLGRFDTKRERDKALAGARLEHERGGSLQLPLCDEYVTVFLREYERRNKRSSLENVTERLKRFERDFKGRSLDIPRSEAREWARGEGRFEKPSDATVQAACTLYNYAIDEDDLPLERNPFRKLAIRTRGRADENPPTPEEFNRLVAAARSLGDYGQVQASMLLFSAYTLMRPGEVYALEWTDIDFEGMRIAKDRRLFRGQLDEPKTGKKVIALTPPARDALLNLPRKSPYVFTTKRGKRFNSSAHSLYWKDVCVRAGLKFDFYHAAKHFGVWHMRSNLKMSPEAVAAQAGWKLSTVVDMLETYGHGEVGALSEVDEAFERAEGPNLHVVEGGKG